MFSARCNKVVLRPLSLVTIVEVDHVIDRFRRSSIINRSVPFNFDVSLRAKRSSDDSSWRARCLSRNQLNIRSRLPLAYQVVSFDTEDVILSACKPRHCVERHIGCCNNNNIAWSNATENASIPKQRVGCYL
jgi:hypothetical protein